MMSICILNNVFLASFFGNDDDNKNGNNTMIIEKIIEITLVTKYE